MPTSLRTRLRGSRAGSPGVSRGPVEYVLLALAAVLLVAMVFLALGQLVDEQMDCQARVDTATAAAAPRC